MKKKLLSIKILEEGKLLNTNMASRILNISNKQLIRLCSSEKINYLKIGNQYRFYLPDILNYKKSFYNKQELSN